MDDYSGLNPQFLKKLNDFEARNNDSTVEDVSLYNPMLDDDDEFESYNSVSLNDTPSDSNSNILYNPMLDDDDEEYVAPRRPNPFLNPPVSNLSPVDEVSEFNKVEEIDVVSKVSEFNNGGSGAVGPDVRSTGSGGLGSGRVSGVRPTGASSNDRVADVGPRVVRSNSSGSESNKDSRPGVRPVVDNNLSSNVPRLNNTPGSDVPDSSLNGARVGESNSVERGRVSGLGGALGNDRVAGPVSDRVADVSSTGPAPTVSSSDNSLKISENINVSKMRGTGTFLDGRVVEAGEWNDFDVDESNSLDTDSYSGVDVSREFGVPVDGLSGGVGERYVERAEFTKEVSQVPRHEGVDSDFRRKTSTVVDVNSRTGVPVNVEEVFIDKYEENDLARVRNQSVIGLGNKINKNEIRFFKNLGYTKKEFYDSGSLLDLGDVDLEAMDKDVLAASARTIDRALGGVGALRAQSKFSFGDRDRDILAFLAMFKYATASQISRMFSTSPASVRKNLRKLEVSGLIRRDKIVNASSLWFLTDAGMLLSGYDLPRTTKTKMNWAMFPHQFTVNHTAANLWGANVNVLNLPDFPVKNRTNSKGEKIYGEELISELELQSSFGKFKIGSRADIYKPQLLARMSSEFDEWKNLGGAEFGPSPEFFEGNEWMWVLFNTGSELKYHVPDLVVKRNRASDGSPQSIAVEIELKNKDWDSYLSTLTAYQTDRRVYDKVIWVCKGLGTAERLEKVAKTIGLWQEGRISITPVLTEDGVFKGDLWRI